jgi:heterodisulfide reductase subunit A
MKCALSKPTSDEVRIGVFICDCGINIAGFIDVPALVEYAKTLPNVAFVQENMYTCSDAGITEIKKGIKEHNLNRVIVASCTPRTHAPLFMSTCETADLNKYLFEFVNIRDQCSWVHQKERDKATQKAKDLIRMGVAKAALLEPREELEAPVEPTSLVIGGGIAGLSAANSLAEQGFKVHLVEREKELGGTLRFINKLFPNDVEAKDVMGSLIQRVEESDHVAVYRSSTVEKVSGYIGNFEVVIARNNETDKNEKVKVGTIIIAIGSKEYKPEGLYGYDSLSGVITQLELEDRLKGDSLKNPRAVVMIQCVGARGQHVSYCSRTCCMVAVKNARLLKKKFPDVELYVFHRGMQTYGHRNEGYYQKAREEGVHFIRFEPESPPGVSASNGQLQVNAYSPTLRRKVDVDCDLVVLSSPQIQQEDAKQIAQMVKVPLGQDGFFFEAHSKLRPVDFATDGIFLCGTTRGPATVGEAVQQALGAASHAAIPLALGKVRAEAITAQVDLDLCSGCGICEGVCPYNALSITTHEGRKIAEVNTLLCKGCGTCVPSCPLRAIKQWGFTDNQLVSQVLEAVKSDVPLEEPNIVGFCCNWCSYAGADMAGVSRFQYPPNLRIIRTMCSGRVDPIWIIGAFLEGADGVFVSGCHPGDCHYITGNNFTKERIQQLRELLKIYGIDPRRLRLEWISASEGNRFAELVTEFTEEIRKLGPSSLRKLKHRRSVDVKET